MERVGRMSKAPNIWRTEGGAHHYGPFARSGEIEIQDAIAMVGKTWSPTRSSAGYTALVRGKPIGKHYPTVAAAKSAVAVELARAT
jgi:hypothetical protein